MAANDLTTLADVREYTQMSSGQTDQDALVSTYITQVSTAIQRWCGREFAPVTGSGDTPTSRKFRYIGGGYLYFAPYDLQDVDTVQIDTDTDSPTTLTENDDFYLLPINQNDGVYTHMELRNLSPSSRSSAVDYTPTRQITVSGIWGFSAVPDDVVLAANIMVAWLIRNHSAIPGNDLAGEGDRFGPVSMPTSVKRLLEPYRVVSFGYGA